MIKHLLLDIDGIVIHREMYFSTRFLKDYGVAEELVQPFFQKEFKECIVGQADLKEEIQKYFSSWNWKKSVDELLQYWFEFESSKDEKILDFVKTLRSQGVACYLQTKNEKYRGDYLWNKVGLKNHFDGIFASSALGYKKPDLEFWNKAWELLGKPKKSDVLAWDNEQEMIDSAKQFGFRGELFTDVDSFKTTMQSLLGGKTLL